MGSKNAGNFPEKKTENIWAQQRKTQKNNNNKMTQINKYKMAGKQLKLCFSMRIYFFRRLHCTHLSDMIHVVSNRPLRNEQNRHRNG